MFYTIRSDIRRAVFSKGFLIGAMGMAVVIVLSSMEEVFSAFLNSVYLPNDYHAQIILDALLSQSVMFIVPIASALPFTHVFVDDIRSGFIKQSLPRSGVKSYISGKLVACAISGGLVLVLGILLAFGLVVAVMMPMEKASGGGAATLLPIIRLLGKICTFFLSGMFWSLLGFMLASVTKSRYMAHASPFVFYYVLVILYERYFNKLYWLYPKEWLNPSHYWVLGNWSLVLVLLTLIAAAGAGFAIFARRELRHG